MSLRKQFEGKYFSSHGYKTPDSVNLSDAKKLLDIACDLLEALKREHEYAVTLRQRDMETMRTPMERHREFIPNCPVCQLIRRVSE